MLRKRILAAFVLTGLAGGLAAAAPAYSARDDGPAGDGPAWDGPRWDGDHHEKDGADGAVFVQTNKPLGNTIQVFDRADNGVLTMAGEYQTGGLGGATIGPPVDALASQGSLIFSDGLLFAVNAGSNTVSLFRVNGDKLDLLDVTWSGGLLPVSVAVHEDLVYVLNAGGDGAVQGFRIEDEKLARIEDSTRSLDLVNSNPPAFATAPAQIGVDPERRVVLVTTKGNNMFEATGSRTGAAWRRTRSSTPTRVRRSGSPSTPTASSCRRIWHHRRHPLPSSAGTARPPRSGRRSRTARPRPAGSSGSATTSTSPTPAAPPSAPTRRRRRHAEPGRRGRRQHRRRRHRHDHRGGILYVQNAAAGNVQGYQVNDDGSLTLITTVDGLPQFANGIGMEGIAAS